ncbi:MAG TPA: thioredoxin domain-containing protein, partial [Saprospiraceae bacterium]|nr:thioredoxin domain-containing protein [Saprospiraceae bacterium]
GDLLYNDDYSTKAKNALARASTEINKTSSPESYASWLKLASLIHRTPYEIAITGDNSEQFRAEMQKHYLPDAIYLGGKTEGTLELLKGKVQSGSTLIYVCKEKVCKLPQKTVKEALAEMK